MKAFQVTISGRDERVECNENLISSSWMLERDLKFVIPSVPETLCGWMFQYMISELFDSCLQDVQWWCASAETYSTAFFFFACAG